MKISLNWLKDYVDYNGSIPELEEIFMKAGLPVEEVEQVGDDWMLDVEVTSNRNDCLGHIGLAREVCAATGAELKMPEVKFTTSSKNVSDMATVENQAKDDCKRYTARLIENIKIGPSPEWLQKKLETVGVRSINNIVDITNYVMLEIGQPLHAFDFNKVGGRTIVIRHSNEEEMQMIDHSTHKFDKKSLFICDGNAPVALAGIMGGCESEVSDQTTDVLLESAWFNPLSVRRTARKYALGSDSSYRFERNVDIWMTQWASSRAISLMQQLAGGEIASGIIDDWQKEGENFKTVTMRISRLNMLTGIHFDSKLPMDILAQLGYSPEFDNHDTITCHVPSWRINDVTREADLIEEVVRVYGFDQIPTDEKIHIKVKNPDKYQQVRQQVVSALNGVGYYEAVNVSFIDDAQWKMFGEGKPITVLNNTRRANNTLRPSLLPSLLTVCKTNQDAGNSKCNVFELAKAFQSENGKTKESTKMSLLTIEDFRKLRGAIEHIVKSVDKRAELVCKPAKVSWAKDEAGAELLVGDKNIGVAGLTNDKIKGAFGLELSPAMAEIDFDTLIELSGKVPTCLPIYKFPAIVRDLSIVIDEAVTWAEIEAAVTSANIEEMRDVKFIDIYRGKGVDKGKKSLTLSITFRKADGTLTHEEAEKFQENVLAILKDKFDAELRAL